MSDKPTVLNHKDVIDMYVSQGCSTHQIAEKYSTYPNKIRRLLKKLNIPLNNKSQAQKKALESGRSQHPTEGTIRPVETKRKISQKSHEYWVNLSEEEKQKKVDEARQRWNNLSEAQKNQLRKSATDAVRKAAKEGSQLERFVYDNLKNKYRMMFHKTDLIPNHNLEIDMYLPDLNVAIEIDGPAHFFPIWGKTEQERYINLQKHINADSQKSGLLLSYGMVIIRVKNVTKTLSERHKYETLDRVIEELNKIETKFPEKGYRFIELEVS